MLHLSPHILTPSLHIGTHHVSLLTLLQSMTKVSQMYLPIAQCYQILETAYAYPQGKSLTMRTMVWCRVKRDLIVSVLTSYLSIEKMSSNKAYFRDMATSPHQWGDSWTRRSISPYRSFRFREFALSCSCLSCSLFSVITDLIVLVSLLFLALLIGFTSLLITYKCPVKQRSTEEI